MATIYIDADACPVKAETLKVAERHRVPVVIVSNGGIRPSRDPMVTTVVVPEGPDAADQWIAERIGPGDVCVTGDIPLAARCIEKGGQAVRHNGDVFTEANIGHQLAMRDLMADLRAANPLGVQGGGRPFSQRDRSQFLQSLDRLVRRSAGA
ncbi:YaiI/YqxD family protein [Acuticoccus sp. M5D2P5]|uniref:YaiI/YqxD family protein n=1 Tax=Acuticoccus kalidii TaxID=2910977 RepID=UPI001F446C52|nr:YaiI/YqxD family protein [Acuticoccus kalidii]MCF3935927.1 YaiI/YqxD family protein [Acuticoccus kalidii]